MVQRGDQLCFALETDDKMGVLLQIRVQQLDRNETLEMRIERFADLCHAAVSQLLQQFIFAQALGMCTHNSLSSCSNVPSGGMFSCFSCTSCSNIHVL